MRMTAEDLTSTFDEKLWSNEQPWSRAYWRMIAQLNFEPETLYRLDSKGTHIAGAPPSKWVLARLFWNTNRIRAFAVSRELNAHMMDSWGFWWLRDRLLLGWWRTDRVVASPD